MKEGKKCLNSKNSETIFCKYKFQYSTDIKECFTTLYQMKLRGIQKLLATPNQKLNKTKTQTLADPIAKPLATKSKPIVASLVSLI